MLSNYYQIFGVISGSDTVLGFFSPSNGMSSWLLNGQRPWNSWCFNFVWFDISLDPQVGWIYPQFMPHTPRKFLVWKLWPLAFNLEARTLDIKYPSFYGQHDCGSMFSILSHPLFGIKPTNPDLRYGYGSKLLTPNMDMKLRREVELGIINSSQE